MSLPRKSVLLAFLLVPFLTCAQIIPASAASKYIGKQGTVCGRIAEAHTATTARGTPTFIDFEQAYPNQTFTAVIWQRDKSGVGNVPKVGVLCVSGTIVEYRGRPEIVLHNRSDWSTPQAKLSNDNHYKNVDGRSVHSPAYSSAGVPSGATAQCADGTYSFSTHRRGTCSHHGGAAKWL